MKTVNKLKEQEAQAEEARKQAYLDTVAETDGANAEEEATTQEQQQDADLLEENRKLTEALNALRGKYNAEVPRLTQQLRETQQQLEAAKVERKKAEDSAKQANDQIKEQLARLRSDYGDEIVDVLEAIADKPQETAVQTDDSVERFWRNLRRRVPDFDAVNSSNDFIAWLQTTSPNGFSYQQVLNEAGNDLDYETCAEIFAAFKNTKTQKPKQKADDFETPPRGQKREPEQKKMYGPSDWVKLQEDIRKGRYRGREAEAAALEKEIHAAIHGF